MFQSKYIPDVNDQNTRHRERQLVAKFGTYFEAAWVEVECNGVPIKGATVFFSEPDDPEVNLLNAQHYAESFNEVWVIVEMVTEALSIPEKTHYE